MIVLFRLSGKRGSNSRPPAWEAYRKCFVESFSGADTGTRTRDLFITNELLYQLSHIGLNFFDGAKVITFLLISEEYCYKYFYFNYFFILRCVLLFFEFNGLWGRSCIFMQFLFIH